MLDIIKKTILNKNIQTVYVDILIIINKNDKLTFPNLDNTI